MNKVLAVACLATLSACNTTTNNSTTGGGGGTGGLTTTPSSASAFSSTGYATSNTGGFAGDGTTFTTQAIIMKGKIDSAGMAVDSLDRGTITLKSKDDTWTYTDENGKSFVMSEFDPFVPDAVVVWDSATKSGAALAVGRGLDASGYGLSQPGASLTTSGGTAIYALIQGTDLSNGYFSDASGILAFGIVGYNTNPNDMPSTGTASYSGDAFISIDTDVVPGYGGNYSAGAYGTASLSADFVAQAMSGSLNFVQLESSDESKAISSKATLSNGTISGNTFSADLNFEDLGSLNLTDGSADLVGDFYEQGGNAVGGSILGTATVDSIDDGSADGIRNTPASIAGLVLAGQ